MARKPTFSPDQDMDNVTPQDLADAKMRTKQQAAYSQAKMIGPKETAPAKSPEQKVPTNSGETTNAMGDTYKKGGMTASARADGCATKGKTKGRFV
jgi:hypothetical protein